MKKYQSMNLVYTTPEGYEIWLGDYYAATNLNLLKQKKITSGSFIMKFSFNRSCDAGYKIPERSRHQT